MRIPSGESEFVLLKAEKDSNGKREEFDQTVYAQDTAFENAADILDEMTSCLDEMGIGELKFVQFHGESAPGQFEIVTDHYDAMDAVDKLLETRATICMVAHPIRQIFLGSIPNIEDGVYRLHTRAMGLWGYEILSFLAKNRQ